LGGKMKGNNRSISKDVIISLVLAVSLITGAFIIINYFLSSRTAKADLERKADEYLIYLEEILELPMYRIDNEVIKTIGRSYGNNELIAKLKIIDITSNKAVFEQTKKAGGDLIERNGDIFYNGVHVGYIEIGLTSQIYRNNNIRLLRTNLIIIFTVILILIGMTEFFMHLFLKKPLTLVMKAIDKIADGSYAYSIRNIKRKEIELILARFDYMASRVKNREDDLKSLNKQLKKEISAHKKAKEEIIDLNETLESRVIERTRALENANKELESFSYSVSHDLRAPLRAVSGFSNVLLEKHSDALTGEGQHYVNRIVKGSHRMSELIDDMLNLSRIGRKSLEKQFVEINLLIEKIFEGLSKEIKNRKIEFNLNKCPKVLCDKKLMRNVFTNLLSNAIKFTRTQEVATIRTGLFEEDTNKFTFFIKDNGIGFDMKYAEKLFTPFQRLHSEADFEGTGIGLVIVKRIINKHGGEVWVDSKKNKGTTFYFTLLKGDKNE
jgi:signal transduction histidine kinase